MLDDIDKKLQKEESYLQKNWQEDKSPFVIHIFKKPNKSSNLQEKFYISCK